MCIDSFLRVLISTSTRHNLCSGKSLNGYVYVQRNYDVSLPHNKIPEALCELAKELAKPTLPAGVEFQPEAAIVNYFGLGMLKAILFYIEFQCVVTPLSPFKFDF